MDEKRQKQRWKTTDYYDRRGTSNSKKFDIIDLNINRSIGFLVDINANGMRLQSDAILEKGVIFKLRIDLPEEIQGSDQLVVDARSLWCQKNVEEEYYHTGFEFLSKFPHHDEIINLLFKDAKVPQNVK